MSRPGVSRLPERGVSLWEASGKALGNFWIALKIRSERSSWDFWVVQGDSARSPEV